MLKMRISVPKGALHHELARELTRNPTAGYVVAIDPLLADIFDSF